MKAIDIALLDARGRVLEGHLRRVEAALPAAPETFRHGIAVFDVVVEQNAHRRGRPADNDELDAIVVNDRAVRERVGKFQRW